MKTGMNTVLRKIQKRDLDKDKFCTIFEDMTPFSLSKSYVGSVQDFEEIASHFFQGFATKLPPGTYMSPCTLLRLVKYLKLNIV